VTATDAEDRVFADAVRGAHVAIAAPGVDVLVPAPRGLYDYTSGTSVAAAHVSGVVALMLERDPRLDVREVRRALRESAQDLGAAGPDPVFGAGLIDAGRAVDGIGNRLRGAELAPSRR
jgi:subtilisin family serine protease